ncbi:hypothetical protein Lal_00000767 [Lupinus albus]|nr:hypothetical protein Lal_00000767 [Lupinus albus]
MPPSWGADRIGVSLGSHRPTVILKLPCLVEKKRTKVRSLAVLFSAANWDRSPARIITAFNDNISIQLPETPWDLTDFKPYSPHSAVMACSSSTIHFNFNLTFPSNAPLIPYTLSHLSPAPLFNTKKKAKTKASNFFLLFFPFCLFPSDSENNDPLLFLCHSQVSFSSAPRRTIAAVTSRVTIDADKPVSDNRMLVFVPPHPLIKHWVSVLRNEQTPSPIFRNAMAELGRLLMYEASRDWLPTVSGEILSPMGVASVEFIDPREPVAVIPILRAGLALAEHASSILPATKTYHLALNSVLPYGGHDGLRWWFGGCSLWISDFLGRIMIFFPFLFAKGIIRDEETLQPTIYLNKLPENFPEGSKLFVVDPMLATGGTIVAALSLLKERGVGNKQIKVISACAAPPALQKLSEQFPGLHVYTGIIDPTVNDKGLVPHNNIVVTLFGVVANMFIIPGLGDAGDRSYGT